MKYPNLRIKYLLVLLVVVLMGLASRRYAIFFPEFIAEHAGDALWAAMVYYICRLIYPNKKLFLSAIAALIFSFLIELSQLYQAPWINAVRANALGALILGHGFLYIDLLRYTSGVIAAIIMDRWLLIPKNKFPSQ